MNESIKSHFKQKQQMFAFSGLGQNRVLEISNVEFLSGVHAIMESIGPQIHYMFFFSPAAPF